MILLEYDGIVNIGLLSLASVTCIFTVVVPVKGNSPPSLASIFSTYSVAVS